VLRRSVFLVALAALAFPSLAPGKVLEKEELMPGVTYTQELRTDEGVPIVVHSIVAPRPGGLYGLKPVLSNDRILGRETVSSMQKRLSPSATTVGVNGDLFTWDTGRPSGIVVRDGVVSGRPNPYRSMLAIGLDGLLRVTRVDFFGFWRVGDGPPAPLSQLNNELDPKTSAAGVFTPAWGDTTPRVPEAVDVVLRGLPPTTPGVDLTGTVAEIRTGGGTPIPPDGAVVQGVGAAANDLFVGALPGSPMTLRIELRPWWPDAADAIGGGPVIVRNGHPAIPSEGFTPEQLRPRNPRTAVGQLADGRILLVAVDGRSDASGGVRIWDLAREMLRLGAVTAMALDSGGSTTIAFDGRVLNTPSDGAEREVSDALMVLYYGAFLPALRYGLVSPNGDGVADAEEGLAYKVVRPSTVDARLIAPDGSIRWQEQTVRGPGVYRMPAVDLSQQGTYTWTIAATDDQGLPSTMSRTFDVNSTLGFFRVSKRSLRPRGGRVVKVSFSLGNAAKVNVIVVNARDRVVRRLFGKRADPGDLELTWDGRNNRGRFLAPGTYELRVKASNDLGRLVEERPVVLRR
jgi:hypothetical protein